MANLYGSIEPTTEKDIEVTVCDKLHVIISEGEESKIAVMIPHDLAHKKIIEYMSFMDDKSIDSLIEGLVRVKSK